MKNCVFADEHNVLDKLDYLFQHPAELQMIADAGYHLVHSRHTLKNRDQILQWFTLWKTLAPHQKIIQTSPFAPLTIVNISAEVQNFPVVANGLHLKILSEGNDRLLAGDYEEAELLYRKCLGYMQRLPEAKLRLALCSLYKGDAKMARYWTFELLQYTLAEYNSIDPDPIEWAYYVISLICLGKLSQAAKRASQFPWLSHPELDRVRWVVKVLQHKCNTASMQRDRRPKFRPSIYHLPSRGLREWCEQIRDMLRACHQDRFDKILGQILSGQSEDYSLRYEEECKMTRCGHVLPEKDAYSYSVATQGVSLPQRRRDALGSFNNHLILYKIQRKVKNLIGEILEYMEGKFVSALTTQSDVNSE
jgi:tetratricopeptide (TPR) repeat protein